MNRLIMDPPGALPAIHRSLALDALVQQIRADRRYEILDLGRALGTNVEFWEQFHPKLYIADLYRSLNFPGVHPQESEEEEGGYEFRLCFGVGVRFDIILAWDLFNYLEREPLEALIRRLGSHCKPRALVFAMMSSLQQIPSHPFNFRIVDRERLSYENTSSDLRPCPRYQPRDIGRMMEGFEVFNSFILRHGIQEYLFIRE